MSTRSRSRNTVSSQSPSGSTTITTVAGTGNSFFCGLVGTEAGTTYPMGQYYFGPGFESKVGVDETISDETGGGMRSFKRCSHVKREWNFPLTTLACEGRRTGEGGYAYRNKTAEAKTQYQASAGWAAALVGSNAFPDWGTAESAKELACSKLNFGIPYGRTNLAVFVGELSDFKVIYELVMRRFRLRKAHTINETTLRAAASTFQKKLKKATFGERLAWLASGDLFYQFAIRPFISDVQELAKTGQKVRSARESLRDPTRIYRTVGGVSSSSSDGFIAEGSDLDVWTEQVRSYSRRITAWARYRLDFSSVPEVSDAAIAGHILGLNNPLQVAWELLPFSFVLDYFVKVGDCLNQFRGDSLSIPFTIIQQGTSSKTTFESSVRARFFQSDALLPYHNNSAGPESSGSYRETVYDRRSDILPIGAVSLPTVSLPNLRQVANLSDLVYLMGRRRA